MSTIKKTILEEYLKTYRELLSAESEDDESVTISFPLHFASHHRIEVTIESTSGRFVITDLANTIGQLRDAGYKINEELKERLEQIAKYSGIRTVGDHLVLESSEGTLGNDIQKFLEAAKTIGDVYLVHKTRVPTEKHIVAAVKDILRDNDYIFKERAKVGGELEGHTVDLLIPPNGTPGLALAVLAAQNTHNAAQVWGFRCEDIKRQPQNKRLRVGLVYDTANSQWSEESRRILESRADIAVSSELVQKELLDRITEKGIKAHG